MSKMSAAHELATILYGIQKQVENVCRCYKADPRSPKNCLEKHYALMKVLRFADAYADELRQLAKAAKRESLVDEDEDFEPLFEN